MRLKELRADRHCTQKQIAERVCSAAYFINLLSSDAEVSPPHQKTI